ncbi:MAG: hypothetical protein QGI45_07295 [Myxococcota bacterium]|jgi:hypothetical protein|nr:hypothetical protein [Myxococcota bacterium]
MLEKLSTHASGLSDNGRFSIYYSAQDKDHLSILLDAATAVGAEASKRWPDMTPNLRLIHGNEVVISLFNTKDPAQIRMLKSGIE